MFGDRTIKIETMLKEKITACLEAGRRSLKKRCRAAYRRWRGWSLRKRIIVASSGLAGLILFYYLAAFAGVPSIALDLERLKDSYEREKSCREECAAERRRLSERIIAEITTESGRSLSATRRIEKYFSNENSDYDFRRELVRILQRAGAEGKEAMPPFLTDYLSAGSSLLLRSAILDIYGSHEAPALLFTIISESEEELLATAAIRVLARHPEQEEIFSINRLEELAVIILNPSSNSRLRSELVLLLGDYYPFLPEETAALLLALDEAEAFGDEVSRAFAVDTYNLYCPLGQELPLPPVSAAAWDEYYNY